MLRKLSDIVERNGRWHKRWEDRLCSLIGINIIKINFIQDNLQIQCNHYQNSNGYLYRTRMNDSKFVGKRKRSWTAKITLRKNLTEGIILPDYTPSYTPRYSKQTAWCTTTKTNTLLNELVWRAQKCTLISAINVLQRRQEYTLGDRQPFQQMVLNKLNSYRQNNHTGLLSHFMHKNKLKRDWRFKCETWYHKISQRKHAASSLTLVLVICFWKCFLRQGNQKLK